MTTSFYEPGPQRARRVEALFNRIAPRYDLINDVQSLGLHRRWKRRLLELAEVRPGQRALDLCCGTGDIALRVARAGASVTGMDFSRPMLAVAQQRGATDRTRADRQPRVRWCQGDALRLPFAAGSFDLVTIGYGLRNLADFETGLSEMLRVLRPGGRLLILDFGKPSHRLWRAIYFIYLRRVVPMFGRLLCGDASAYAYILESLEHYPAPDGVVDLMRRAGFDPADGRELLGGVMTIHSGRRP